MGRKQQKRTEADSGRSITGHQHSIFVHLQEKLRSEEVQNRAVEAGAKGIRLVGCTCVGQDLQLRGVHYEDIFSGHAGNNYTSEAVLATGAIDAVLSEFNCTLPGIEPICDSLQIKQIDRSVNGLLHAPDVIRTGPYLICHLNQTFGFQLFIIVDIVNHSNPLQNPFYLNRPSIRMPDCRIAARVPFFTILKADSQNVKSIFPGKSFKKRSEPYPRKQQFSHFPSPPF